MKASSEVFIWIKRYTQIVLSLLVFIALMGGSCQDSGTDPIDDDNNNKPTGIKFLVGYRGGGDHGAEDGMCLVSNSGQTVQFLSTYRPMYSNNEYVSYKNKRIAFATWNTPEEGQTFIAYFDVADPTNVKIVPNPVSDDKDYYWSVPQVRPQVFSDGRIAFLAFYLTTNPWDDWHSGHICIYNPKTNEYKFSPAAHDFILNQPEQGYDTETGSLGGDFALSQDEQFVIARAYGYGVDMGSFHTDYKFIVKWDIHTDAYQRVAEGENQICFVSADNQSVIANINYKKNAIDINTGNMTLLDEYYDNIACGMYSEKDGKFFKQWRGGGIALFDKSSGWLFNPVLGDSMPYPYRGLGTGSQFSPDETKIYFKGTLDYNTNYASDYCVYSTPLTLGYPNSKPDSLFILTAQYDTGLFILLD